MCFFMLVKLYKQILIFLTRIFYNAVLQLFRLLFILYYIDLSRFYVLLFLLLFYHHF